MQRFWDYTRILSSGRPVPNATIDVFVAGTLTRPTIYADNDNAPLGNPFTSDANGYFFFYAADGRYDVRLSGGSGPQIITPYTWFDILLDDGRQRLTANLDVYV